MTYKEKFEASEYRAHYKNIATKILREMTSLRSLVENSPIAPRRWIWELIQNAKDVHQSDGVRIIIDYYKDGKDSYISFKHNGKPFTADNIRFLIEQISSKDRDKNDEGKPKTTGKFGTGFLTTHLLSEKVLVKGVAKEPELDYRKFELELDRSGFHLDEITDSVQISKDSVQDLDDKPIFNDYEEGKFNTSFTYYLTDEIGHSVANKGLNDLEKCLPYTFVFVEELKAIKIKQSGKLFKNTMEFEEITPNIKVIKIRIKEGDEPNSWTSLEFAYLSKNLTTIAIPVKIGKNQIVIKEIEEGIPKLFCDFPLIGTESFNFPVIINNPNFNPTDPRDGVFLTTSQRENPLAESNKEYIREAIELYYELLEFASNNEWLNLHLLAHVKPLQFYPNWVSELWYKDNILKNLRQKLLYTPIVKTANDELKSILTEEGKKYIWFPQSTSKKYRKRLWDIAKQWFPWVLPCENEIEIWNKLIWKDCGKLNSDQLSEFIENKNSISELAKVLENIDSHEWLNKFYEFIKEEDDEYDSIINNRAIFPNQYGVFVKKSKLYKDKGDISDDLKLILNELGNDIKDVLLHKEIEFELGDDRVIDINYIVKEINSEVSSKANDREIAKDFKSTFKKLLLWFKKNPETAKELFPNLYKNKHLLYDDDEILVNIEKAEMLEELMSELNISEISEIRNLIEKGLKQKSILPITENILTSMGITSLEEWQEAIQDKNLSELFSHESTPTTDMFVYVQGLIEKAKKNVIEVLTNLPEYNLDNLDTSTAPTVLAGVLKGDKEISIIVRPAYNNEVIIYYGSERDILDYEPSELWIDDNVDPRQITLGHILKSSNIVKFPV
ncbi:MAG: sacsin N-terminal ATP-binding-like domain-containing protein [bacterium]